MNADPGEAGFGVGLDDNENGHGIGFDGVENQRPSTAPEQAVQNRPSTLPPSGVSEAGLRAAGKVDLVARMEAHANAIYGQTMKQRQARLRRADKVHARQKDARERNMRHRERMRMIKKLRQQGDLERWHLGNQLRTEAERQTSSNELVGKILRELTKDVKKEDRMNAEYLQRLEQQRISQAASTSVLFSDRSQMIKEMADEAAQYQSRMLKEQERFMDNVMREAEIKQKVNLEAKLQQLNMVEEECLSQSREAQVSLAELFNVDTYKYVTKDRVTGVPKSPFEGTLRKIRSNALMLRQQQNRKMKLKKLRMAYNAKPFFS
jgi:hypothetical protein